MHLEGGFQSDVFLSLHEDGPINGRGAYKSVADPGEEPGGPSPPPPPPLSLYQGY